MSRQTCAAAILGLAGWLAVAGNPGAAAAADPKPAGEEDRAAAEESPSNEPPKEELPVYTTRFDVTLVPSERAARVTIELGADAGPVEWILFRIDPSRHTDFKGDGEIAAVEDGIEWRPPESGGSLHYTAHIDHLRDERSYDARCARRWAVFRGEDLVPTVRVRTDPIARSQSRMRLRLPEGWSAAVPYPRSAGGEYRINDPRSRFDRPEGWFALGDIGVLREKIAGVQVAVAGPTRHGLRRHDILALLTWTLPSLRDLFGVLPERLLVLGAGDPMWRGGLSGPGSVFIHSDRPLISEDGTSPILHELIHSLMRASAGNGGDWIVEGLAELYSLEALYRSGTLSDERYQRAVDAFAKAAPKGGKLRARSVTGETLAKAVVALRELDAQLRSATEGAQSLDQVVRLLADDERRVTTKRFRAFAEQVGGRSLEAFFKRHAPEQP